MRRLVAPVWSVLALATTILILPPSVVDVRADETVGVWAPTSPPEVTRRLRDTSLPLRDDGSRGLQKRRLAGEKAPDGLDAILVMCDFADSLLLGRHGQVPGEFPPPAQSVRYYAAHDSLYFDHLLLDVADYFTAVSGGAFEFRFTIHPRAVNLPEPMSWYGNHPTEGEQSILMAAAVVESLQDEVDFTLYDTVLLVHAGAGEETDILGNSPEQIFSTYLDPDDFRTAFEDEVLPQAFLPATGFPAGTGIDRVLVLPETERQDPIGDFSGGFGSLGVYCFEVGLHLGMLSLSDFTPSGRPDSQGIGQYGLMGYGLFVGLGFIPPQPCPMNKMLMGWLDPFDADPTSYAEWSLLPADDPRSGLACARIDLTGPEYWLVEYRLQDPNGDRRFTFSGDLNGNGLPDFWDADSEDGDFTPTGPFDRDTDIKERLTDAEWDFAMSENAARALGELGAGSGFYIWHVDEGVIRDRFHAASNLFNADPRRKAVDLEEADGIQDLDSSEPSDFMLGSDDDSFRGEDHQRFAPDTRPNTHTSSGAVTGITFSAFSRVVRDSAAYTVVVDPYTYPGYDYADTLTFTLSTAFATPAVRTPSARRSLPAGVDATNSHLLIGNLDGVGATNEIVLAADRGEVYVLDGDLNEYLDHDLDPATLKPFAIGARGGVPVAWNLPAAMGDLDGDLIPEIVLTGPDGLYAFNGDGSPVRDVEALANGLYANLERCELPPVLMAADGTAEPGDPHTPVSAVVATTVSGSCRLEFYQGPDGDLTRTVDLGVGFVASSPVVGGAYLVAAIADTLSGGSRLAVVRASAFGIPEDPEVVYFPLDGTPGPWPPLVGRAPGSTEDPVTTVTVLDVDGRGETVRFDSQRRAAGAGFRWPEGLLSAGPLGPGGAFVSEGRLGRVGQAGDWLAGWPVRPQPSLAAGRGMPLVARLLDASCELEQYLFCARDGRMLATCARGEPVSGWPLAGPARSVATPALGQLGGGPDVDLAAVGSFRRIVDTAALGDSLNTEFVTWLTVWRDVAAPDPVWPMWGGSPWRDGGYDVDGFVTSPAVAAGSGLVPGSHICYPSPLMDGPLNIRGQVRAAARVRAYVYNLEGEALASSAWRVVPAVEPFTLEVDVSAAVTGLYLCRLAVESHDGESENSVIQFAIVR